MELFEYSAYDIHQLLLERKVSAVEIVKAFIERIAQVDGRSGSLDSHELSADDLTKVHSFITLTPDTALEQAHRVDEKLAAGEDPGSLAGVPFTVKDIFCVEGVPATAASRILANFRAPYTATPVSRMQAAGGLMLGKVNLDEFTYGSSNESSAFQPSPRNPWNLAHVPGGSSGGSSTSVAAYEACLSLGTDTAGSIRQPAAFCGVVGMKPTYGRVSRYGLIAFGSSLDCPGPVARDTRDAAMMMNVIAGPDFHDSTAATVEVPDYLAGLENGVNGMRIGLSPDYFRISYPDASSGEYIEQPVPAEFERAVYAAAEKLAAMGAEIIEDVAMPNTRNAHW